MLRNSPLPKQRADPGEIRWLDSVEIAEARWRMDRDFALGVERVQAMRPRMLLRLRRRPHLLRHRQCMRHLLCRLRLLRRLRVRQG